ncbi:MAG: hypothetical protein R6U85_13485 [Salinivirgaceae bacterium]
MELLQNLCQIHAPAGEEYNVRDFIIDFFTSHENWKQKPELFYGKGYQDCLLVKFGTPTKAFMAHMDNIGFTAGYENELIPIGSPAHNDESIIRNEQNQFVDIYYDNNHKTWVLKNDITLTPGESWSWKPHFTQKENYIETPFLDNRLSIYTLLKMAPELENTVLAFSTYEETPHGGKAAMLARILFEKWQIDQIIITDITWETAYVKTGKGVVVSSRDIGIPRKKFKDHICKLLTTAGIAYQTEIEKSGGSDGTSISSSPYPIDWLFIGAPEINPHGYTEKVHMNDIESMIKTYKLLSKKL